ncbi:MAG: sulfite exporter TauE/SafE family protein, partial [Rhodospirillales bacterium]|nr:sulfite exporter TauE/SafE family protein [Rhodospirillales bacterium]
MALAADADTLGLAFAMLLAGLAGGFAHCAGMCGPFVVAQTL